MMQSQELEAGADDYVTKPFRLRELLAHIGAVLRRGSKNDQLPPPVLPAGNLELDREHRTLRRAGEQVQLSPIEFNLLAYLMRDTDMPIEHATLLRATWGPQYGHELEYLRTYIRLIRKKIKADPRKPEYIITDPWRGYRLCVPPQQETGHT